MFYAVIDTESLSDPKIVNSFKQLRVEVEYEPNSTASKYHHVFFLQIKDEEVGKQMDKFSREMKDGWYAFFWNNKILYIIFNKERFRVGLPVKKQDLEYLKSQEYGRLIGIQGEFLDFDKYFKRYDRIASKNDSGGGVVEQKKGTQGAAILLLDNIFS